MMLLTQWLLRGIAMDKRFAEKPDFFLRYVNLWSRVMADYVEPRAGVTGPPALPSWPGDNPDGD